MEDLGVPELFIGKTVFLTGGTGFIGKVLIEKLLRSCSGVKKIYVLIRERRGKSIQERIDEMSTIPVIILTLTMIFLLFMTISSSSYLKNSMLNIQVTSPQKSSL